MTEVQDGVYSLFGTRVTFPDPALRFFDLLHFKWEAQRKLDPLFVNWYNGCGDIEQVLDAYPAFSTDVLYRLATRPLFEQLAEYGIYDLSEESYRERSTNCENVADAFEQVVNAYDSILRTQAGEEAYRAARKDSRARWSGGGFGMQAAINASIQAGAMNLATGLGHSVLNGIGNTASAIKASGDKNKLYRDPRTQTILLLGIKKEIAVIVGAHIACLNSKMPGAAKTVFDEDKAKALFENAKKLPEKAASLLPQAVANCPWYHDLISYIFVNFPDERKEISRLAKRFFVDLSGSIETMLEREYDASARQSEEGAMRAKARILALMREYGAESSKTLTTLDTDCLTRYIQGYETADEAACNELRAKIEAYDAPAELKQPFLDRVQARIEQIWSAEDGEIFDNVYLNTNIRDAEEVAKAIEFIKSKGRTASSEQYLNALRGCNEKNIRKAQKGHQQQTILILGIVAGLVLAIFTMGIGAILSVICLVILTSNRKAWKRLTLNGKILHPVIAEGAETKKKKKK